MESAESFTQTLTELEAFVLANLKENCPLRWRIETLREHWTTFSAYHRKLATQLEQLKTSSPVVTSTRTEGLKLITRRDTTAERSTYQSYESLFSRRTQNQQIQQQQAVRQPQQRDSEESSGYDDDLDRSPSPGRMTMLDLTPMSPSTPSGAELGVKALVRKLSIISMPSSSMSTTSSSPTLSSMSASPTSASFSSDTSKTIRQKGNENKYAFFQEIFHSPILDHVTCFILSFIQVDTKVLFDSLERCPNLTHIELMRVIFIGPLNRRITIPKLKTFLVHQITSERRLCESRNLTPDEFANLVFFAPLDKDDLIPPDVTKVEVSVDGWTMYKLNWDSGEFVSRLSFASYLLTQLQGKLPIRRLALQGCKFKLNADETGFEKLTYLNLQSILTSSQDLTQLLTQCPDLQELRFKNYMDGGRLHLKDIPSRKMKFLCLGLCTFTVSIKYSPGVQFQHLDTLVFPINIMDDETLKNLPLIFRTKKAIVYLCSHGSRCKTGYFVLDKLLQIESIESIWLSNFRRSLLGEDLQCPEQLGLRDTYEEFLVGAGLPHTATTSVMLERKEIPAFGSPYNVPKTFKWIGRQITTQEHQVLEFQNRDGYKFSTWEAYMKRY